MNNHNPNTSKPTSSQSTPNQNDGDFDISQSSYKTSHTAVRKARRFALQGIFEWLATDHRFSALARTEWLGNTPHAITARTRADNAMHTVHLGYYHELMREIPNRLDELNALISPHLDRALERLDGIEYSALLIGAYELAHARHIPYKVVIDEAILLNGHFGATDGYKLINAVLDKLAKSLRHEEVASNSTAKTDNNKSKDNQALPKLG